ncbi:hypothetical protein SLA2020_051230 [Shorea laevis]
MVGTVSGTFLIRDIIFLYDFFLLYDFLDCILTTELYINEFDFFLFHNFLGYILTTEIYINFPHDFINCILTTELIHWHNFRDEHRRGETSSGSIVDLK